MTSPSDDRMGLSTASVSGAAEGPGVGAGLAIGERYVLLDPLGAGTSAVVYTAYDRKLDRKIAVKLLHGEAPGGMQLRLLREAQALARLRHPNVVTVHDVGTVGDRVFIAMELVTGSSLRSWLLDGIRSWREVVKVFIDAGRGLAAAHAAGLVHRDFKPDNVLIDRDGSVRVADFGLARQVGAAGEAAEDGARSSPALALDVTRTGAIVGTPRYMSPEQHRGDVADERSDQFAFAVALWEALCGNPPFSGRTSGEIAAAFAAAPTEKLPARVPRRLRGALERALRATPAARFPSMHELIAVLAHDSARARRWAPALVGLLGVAVAALAMNRHAAVVDRCAGGSARLIGVWDATVRDAARRAFVATNRGYAQDTFDRVARRLDEYTAAWLAMREDACRATAVRHEQSDTLLDLRMACLDRRLGALASVTASFTGAVDDTLLSHALGAVNRLEEVEPCADVQALTQALPPPSDPAVRARVAALRAELDRVNASNLGGRYKAALSMVTPILEEARGIGYAPLLAEIYFQLAVVRGNLRDAEGFEAATRAELDAAALAHDDARLTRIWPSLMLAIGEGANRPAEALLLAPAANAAFERTGNLPAQRAALCNSMGRILRVQGDFAGAERQYEQGLALFDEAATQRALTPAEEADRIGLMNNLGVVLKQQGKLAEAAVQIERALSRYEQRLGADHPYTAGTLINLANVVQLEGKYDEARAHLERALAIFSSAQGPDGADVAVVENNLGLLDVLVLRDEDGLRELSRAIDIRTKLFGKNHPILASSLNGAGEALLALGRIDEAEQRFQEALAIRETLGRDHPSLVETLTSLAQVKRVRGAPNDALAYAERALAIAEKHGKQSPELVSALATRARVLVVLDQLDAARADDERALAMSRGLGPDPAQQIDLLVDLSAIDVAQAHPADAIDKLGQALMLSPSAPLPGGEARVRFAMARARWAASQHALSIEAADEARRQYASLGAIGARGAAEVDKWLVTHAEAAPGPRNPR